MMIENTDFNTTYWSRFSESQFIEKCIASGIFEGYQEREQLLKQAYQLIIYDASRATDKASQV